MEYSTPHNLLAEQAVISACLVDRNAMPKALQYIGDRPEYFHDVNHRAYWRCLLRIYQRGRTPDVILLTAECAFERETWVRPIRTDIMHLATTVASSANLQYHCLLLVQTHIKRILLAKGRQLMAESADESIDVFDSIDRIQDLQAQISGTMDRLRRDDPKAILLQYMDKAAAGEFEAQGIAYGFQDIDQDFYQGLAIGLYVVGGEQKMGKTTLGLQFLMAAQDQGKKPAMVSLEMPAERLIENLLSYRTGISKRVLRARKKPDGCCEKMAEAVDYFDSSNIAIVDSNMASDITDIIASIVGFVNNESVDVVIIDYYQLIENRTKPKAYDGLVDASKRLTALAKKLKIPIVLLVQMHKDGYIEHCKQPQKDCEAMFVISRQRETPRQATLTVAFARDVVTDAYEMEVGECGILTMRGIPNFRQVAGVSQAYLPDPFAGPGKMEFTTRVEKDEIDAFWESAQ